MGPIENSKIDMYSLKSKKLKNWKAIIYTLKKLKIEKAIYK